MARKHFNNTYTTTTTSSTLSRSDGSKRVVTDTKTINEHDGDFGLGLLTAIIIVLIALTLVRLLSGSESSVSFTGLLNFLAESDYNVSSSVFAFIQRLEITGDWGIVDFLRDFVNLFLSVNGIVIWLGSAIYDCLMFILNLLQFVFLV